MFWKNLCYLCATENISPNSFVKSIGVKSTGTVTAWKNGTEPRPGTALKIAQHFGVTLFDLLNTDLEKENRLTPPAENEPDRTHSVNFTGLSSEEETALRAFHAGLLAARKL